VAAESLFEAAALAIQILRRDGWVTDAIGAGTRLEVEVREPATKHTRHNVADSAMAGWRDAEPK
jgi:hypothetical protein